MAHNSKRIYMEMIISLKFFNAEWDFYHEFQMLNRQLHCFHKPFMLRELVLLKFIYLKHWI